MPIDLEAIVNFNGNIYEVTNAVIRRAKQITEVGDEDMEKHYNKVVSTSIDQVFLHKVEYRLEQ